MICTFRHPFWVLASCLLGNLGMDPDRVQPTQVCVSLLWVEIFHVLEFSQTNCWYRLTEKSIENVGKLWFEFHIAFGYLAGFHQTFFFTFSNLKFFWNFQKWPSRALNKIIFLAFMCSLGCIWPKKNGFLSVSGHLDLGFSTGPFGPGTGPKSTSTSWYLKG